MSIHRRFALDQNRYVIDKMNPANSGKGYCHQGTSEDDRHLRERVLMVRLGDMLDKLIINRKAAQKYPITGKEYQPFNEESHAILEAILGAIHSSHLNTLDPSLSVWHKSDGRPRREKNGMQDFTSLSLFRDDVESLIRDLYGDIGNEALERVLCAVFTIVREFTRYVRIDLWKEHSDAEERDYSVGIGMPEGCGLSGSEWRRGMVARDDLAARAREVRANPSAFSEYTVEFVKALDQHWPGMSKFKVVEDEVVE